MVASLAIRNPPFPRCPKPARESRLSKPVVRIPPQGGEHEQLQPSAKSVMFGVLINSATYIIGHKNNTSHPIQSNICLSLALITLITWVYCLLLVAKSENWHKKRLHDFCLPNCPTRNSCINISKMCTDASRYTTQRPGFESRWQSTNLVHTICQHGRITTLSF